MNTPEPKQYVEDGYAEPGYFKEELSDLEAQELTARIDSTDWTGLAKRVGPEQLAVIREKSKALQDAILQSDTDLDTRVNACKRVEAVIILLEAPNTPWPEIVRLLNHPSVTAFLAAVNILQLLVGLAS